MISNKFVCIIVVVLLLVVIITGFTMKKFRLKKEPFGMLNLTYRAEPVYVDDNGSFYSTPSLKSKLPPRFNSNGYPVFVKHDMPERQHQAVPVDPLSHSQMVMNEQKIEESDHEETGSMYDPTEYPSTSSLLPIGDMTIGDSLDHDIQAVTMNNLMYTNRNSRLRAMADPIRGDIPVEDPDNRLGGTLWRPSVNPSIDLHAGAMNVMGGFDNESSRRLAEIMYADSGYTKRQFGGAEIPEHEISMSHNLADIDVSAF
jgi:hypothetical protein